MTKICLWSLNLVAVHDSPHTHVVIIYSFQHLQWDWVRPCPVIHRKENTVWENYWADKSCLSCFGHSSDRSFCVDWSHSVFLIACTKLFSRFNCWPLSMQGPRPSYALGGMAWNRIICSGLSEHILCYELSIGLVLLSTESDFLVLRPRAGLDQALTTHWLQPMSAHEAVDMNHQLYLWRLTCVLQLQMPLRYSIRVRQYFGQAWHQNI